MARVQCRGMQAHAFCTWIAMVAPTGLPVLPVLPLAAAWPCRTAGCRPQRALNARRTLAHPWPHAIRTPGPPARSRKRSQGADAHGPGLGRFDAPWQPAAPGFAGQGTHTGQRSCSQLVPTLANGPAQGLAQGAACGRFGWGSVACGFVRRARCCPAAFFCQRLLAALLPVRALQWPFSDLTAAHRLKACLAVLVVPLSLL